MATTRITVYFDGLPYNCRALGSTGGSDKWRPVDGCALLKRRSNYAHKDEFWLPEGTQIAGSNYVDLAEMDRKHRPDRNGGTPRA